MSTPEIKYRKEYWARIKTDPVKHAAYNARKRTESQKRRDNINPPFIGPVIPWEFTETAKAYHRKYYQDRKAAVILRTKKWKSENPEKVILSNKKSYIKNRHKRQAHWLSEKGRASCKKYKATLSVEARRAAANKAMRKMRENPMFRILSNLRGRLCKIMSGQLKAASTMELIGISRDEFRKHLESQFSGGMSWGNYGAIKGSDTMKWHVDHIAPCARFDMSDPMQQRACWHYTNLRPMWGIENISRNRRAVA